MSELPTNKASRQIRILQDADFEAFLDLRLRGLKESPEAFGASYEEWLNLPPEEAAQRMKSTPDSFVLGSFESSRLVGIAGFRREKNIKSRHTAGIWGVYVDVPHRGNGIAKSLMVDIIERARTFSGLEKLTLTVAAHNEGAHALYEKLDFKAYGRDPHALRIDGRYFDEILMVLFLKS